VSGNSFQDRLDRLFAIAGRRTRWLQPDFVRFGAQYHPRPLRFTGKDGSAPLPKNPPLISVVIPSFNQVRFLERAIRSILDQAYPRLELIVVDGGSTDGSREVIEGFSDSLTWWCSEPDAGQANALNKGFARTSGEIMGWLNSDDKLAPGALARVTLYFAGNPEIDALYGHRVLIDEEDREIGRWILPPHSDRVLSYADFIPQETLFWRRGLWRRTGGEVDDSFKFAMDWDLILRFREAGAKFVRLPFFLGLFRVHSGQKTVTEIWGDGFSEMQALRTRCLGEAPRQYQVAIAVAGYLLQARWLEFMWKMGVIRYE
jgi:glycosyltransferase involved in cell wall biosynthesis